MRVEIGPGMEGDFFVDIEVVVLVRWADLGEMGTGIDMASMAVFDRREHTVVGAHGIDVKSEFAIGAQYRAVDDDIGAFGGATYLVQVGNVDLHRLVFTIYRHDIGDAQIVSFLQFVDDVRSEEAIAAE